MSLAMIAVCGMMFLRAGRLRGDLQWRISRFSFWNGRFLTRFWRLRRPRRRENFGGFGLLREPAPHSGYWESLLYTAAIVGASPTPCLSTGPPQSQLPYHESDGPADAEPRTRTSEKRPVGHGSRATTPTSVHGRRNIHSGQGMNTVFKYCRLLCIHEYEYSQRLLRTVEAQYS